jgi:hypothetical protein
VHLSIENFGWKTKVQFVPIAPQCPVRGVATKTANGWFARALVVVLK